MTPEQIKEYLAQMEAIIFAAGEPVGVEQICKGLDLTRTEVDSMMTTLMQRYEFEERGMRILRLDTTYQMCSAPEHAPLIRSILESRSSPKLSQPAIEVLAVIAYYQPTTRIYVDQVRGVDSAYTVGLLVERGLIEECGKLNDVPGRPLLYRTTKNFLRSFNLERIEDLPDLGQPEQENTQLSIEQRLKDLAEEAVETLDETSTDSDSVESSPVDADLPQEDNHDQTQEETTDLPQEDTADLSQEGNPENSVEDNTEDSFVHTPESDSDPAPNTEEGSH